MPCALFFFSQDCFFYLGSLGFFFFTSMKNAIGILIGIALNLQVALISMDVLTILILVIHEQRISSNLFVSSSISLIGVLQFSLYSSFTSLVKFILKSFIIFDSVVYGIVFFISFSDSSLLVYRNAAYFFVC